MANIFSKMSFNFSANMYSSVFDSVLLLQNPFLPNLCFVYFTPFLFIKQEPDYAFCSHRLFDPSLCSSHGFVPFSLDLFGETDAILPLKGIGQKTPRRLGQRCKRRPQGSHESQGRFWIPGLSMSPLIFLHIRLRFYYFWALYLGLHNVGRVPQKCRIFQPLYFRAPRLVFVLGVVL